MRLRNEQDTVDMIFRSPTDAREVSRTAKDLYLIFVDLTKTFDSVSHDVLWKIRTSEHTSLYPWWNKGSQQSEVCALWSKKSRQIGLCFGSSSIWDNHRRHDQRHIQELQLNFGSFIAIFRTIPPVSAVKVGDILLEQTEDNEWVPLFKGTVSRNCSIDADNISQAVKAPAMFGRLSRKLRNTMTCICPQIWQYTRWR